MGNSNWQGPFPDTLEKAEQVVSFVLLQTSGIIYDRVRREQICDMFAMMESDVCDPLRITSENKKHVTIQLARWMDVLPTNVRYIFAAKAAAKWRVHPVTLYDELWKVQADSIAKNVIDYIKVEKCTT